MSVTYYKRYRMEIALHEGLFPGPALPAGYSWVPWNDRWTSIHGETKYRSFLGEVDAQVFPCLGDLNGCQRLMADIAAKQGFVAAATWLVAHTSSASRGGANRSESGYDFAYERNREYFPDGATRPRSTTVSDPMWDGALHEESQRTYCGTVQGIRDDDTGGIQNLGVVPVHRGLGLGRCLLLKALEGFWVAGLRFASLEVTSQNAIALELYKKLGFRRVKTVYKAVEVAYSM